MDTIDNWLDNINQKEKDNNFFYKSPNTHIEIEFLYISITNVVIDKKKIIYKLSKPNMLNKNDLLYLISKHKEKKYKLLDILTYQMSLPANELKYIDTYEGLKTIKYLDDIQFDNVIKYFNDLTCMYILFYEKKHTFNTTKRIHIVSARKQTRRTY
tara:strand:+ start:286 stop:753 length:468 start_codon:yes stop_codon:yes gene_type:complete